MGAEKRIISNGVVLSAPERTLFPYPDLLGFIFHLSWMYLFLYLDEPVGSVGLLGEIISSEPWLYVFSACFLILTLILFAVRPSLAEACERSRFDRIGSPCLIAVGSALFYMLAIVMPSYIFVITLVSGAATGIGSGILAVRWAQNFGLAGMRRIMGIVPSLLVGVTALCVTLPLLPSPFSIACVISFPLLSGVFCTRAHLALSPTENNLTCTPSRNNTDVSFLKKIIEMPAGPHQHGSYAVVIAVVALLGAAIGMLNAIRDPGLSTEYLNAFNIVAVIALLIACAAYLLGQKQPGFTVEFGVPALTLCFLVVLLINIYPSDLYATIRPLGSICLELLFFVSLVCWADFFSLSAVRTFALGRITYATTHYLADTIGKAIPWASGSEALIQANSFALFAGAEIIAVAAALIVFLTRRHAREKERSSSECNESIYYKTEGRNKEENASGTAETSVQPRFHARLMQFSNAFGLTTRETDVAAELIKGRGYAHIADELSIAEGTVNYHTRNIYAKTQVHTREELIDLFDNFETQ